MDYYTNQGIDKKGSHEKGGEGIAESERRDIYKELL